MAGYWECEIERVNAMDFVSSADCIDSGTTAY